MQKKKSDPNRRPHWVGPLINRVSHSVVENVAL